MAIKTFLHDVSPGDIKKSYDPDLVNGFFFDKTGALVLVAQWAPDKYWTVTPVESSASNRFTCNIWHERLGLPIKVPNSLDLTLSLPANPVPGSSINDPIGKLAVTQQGIALCVNYSDKPTVDPKQQRATLILLSNYVHLRGAFDPADHDWFPTWSLGKSRSDGAWSELVANAN